MRSYIRRLADSERSEASDRHLAFCLTFIAGAANAGGFMAVHQYTSHMSGMVSSIADSLVIGDWALLGSAILGFTTFVAGAGTSAILINWAQRRDLHSRYALPLALEGLLLAAFALSGLDTLGAMPAALATVIGLLCFVMGLQNAMITKLSKARIRTTHVTGMVTDIGIELGKLFYRNGPGPHINPVVADRDKLALLSALVGLFFAGGVTGALLFSHLGVIAAMALALPLLVMALFPLLTDAHILRPL